MEDIEAEFHSAMKHLTLARRFGEATFTTQYGTHRMTVSVWRKGRHVFTTAPIPVRGIDGYCAASDEFRSLAKP